MRRGRSSQTSSRTTMLPQPRMTGSKRCHMPFLGAARSSTGATAATLASTAWISLMVLLPGSPWERRAFGPPNAFRQHHGDDHDDDIFALDRMFACIIVIMIIAVVLTEGIRWTERTAFPWRTRQ